MKLYLTPLPNYKQYSMLWNPEEHSFHSLHFFRLRLLLGPSIKTVQYRYAVLIAAPPGPLYTSMCVGSQCRP